MKAIVATQYGSPEVLQLKEVEKPTPTPALPLASLRGCSPALDLLSKSCGASVAMAGDARENNELLIKAHRYVEMGHKKGNVVITLGKNHVEQVQPGT